MTSKYGIKIFDIVYIEYYKHIKFEVKYKYEDTMMFEFLEQLKNYYGNKERSVIYLKKSFDYYYELIFSEYIDVISKIYESSKDKLGKFKSKQHILRCIISIVVKDIINEFSKKFNNNNIINKNQSKIINIHM
jgi:hypothetical protein